ncbi:HD domain-containing protein [Brucepastera parasyntrophica]|uniref:Ppx/GppA phosphatase family protein n=1 Tax=Brucepastera parasyntrophica TaxID=2880008 RepID=UPI002109CEF9|nr:HD domain-containing protein [Brucepastera parasyntrophica]ULQ60904.1 HD domain-containing protein [Brucepastera parasyntrophica]
MSDQNNRRLEAVIEIGATGIRLLVVEVTGDATWLVIDRAERALPLGRDVFTTGIISRESLMQCIAILNRYKEMLAGWGMSCEQVTVVATSAIREARNRDSVVDRVAVKTGFRIKVIDGIEENRLMYLVVDYALSDAPMKLSKTNSIIMDVGGGSTEIMLLKKGKMVAAHSFRMGTVIIEQQTRALMGSEKDMRRFLSDYIRTTAENLNKELRFDLVNQLIAIGGDARLAAKTVGTKGNGPYAEITRTNFFAFIEQLSLFSVEELVQRFKISYSDAESLVPGLLAYQYCLELTSADIVVVPFFSIREGVIISQLSGSDDAVREEFYVLIVDSALNLARKFLFDEAHSRYVTKLSLKLFDSLESELGLDRHARLLLEIASILHDVGNFIRASDHHIHSQYIVSHSDIFGLNKDDMNIISNVVRYHRSEIPSPDHAAYMSLPRNERTMVLKLASLLRIAEALDCGHSQHIKDFDIQLTGDTVFLRAAGTHDVTLERLSLEEKGDLFENVFGYNVSLS